MKFDILGRDEFIDSIINVVNTLSSSKTGCCFAIDGQWGAGKSFVLDILERELSLIQSEETADNQYFIFHYNCWRYDYYDEPSIAVISSMIDCAEKEISLFGEGSNRNLQAAWKITRDKLFTIAGKFVENRIGIDIVDIYHDFTKEKAESIEAKESFDNLFAFNKTLDQTRDLLKEIANVKTIVIVVDELDRCIPAYAIKVLERLHHLFDGIQNTIVVVAIDSKQLEYSVKQIYGEDIFVEKYLKKFISFSLKLDNGKIKGNLFEKYLDYFSKFTEPNESERQYIEENLPRILENIEIREQEKIFEKANLLHSIISSEVQDISVCVFEVMVVRYIKVNNYNLSWLPQINRAGYSDLKLPKSHIDFLKELEENLSKRGTVTSSRTEEYPIIGKYINDKIFWYLSQCFCDKNIYYLADLVSYSKEVDIAKKFCTLLEFIG